jgi:hypothetical protein
MWNSFPALTKSRLDSSIASRNHMIGYLVLMQESNSMNELEKTLFVLDLAVFAKNMCCLIHSNL